MWLQLPQSVKNSPNIKHFNAANKTWKFSHKIIITYHVLNTVSVAR